MELSYEYLAPYKSVNHNKIDVSVRDSADVPRYYGSSMPPQAIMINTNLLAGRPPGGMEGSDQSQVQG